MPLFSSFPSWRSSLHHLPIGWDGIGWMNDDQPPLGLAQTNGKARKGARGREWTEEPNKPQVPRHTHECKCDVSQCTGAGSRGGTPARSPESRVYLGRRSWGWSGLQQRNATPPPPPRIHPPTDPFVSVLSLSSLQSFAFGSSPFPFALQQIRTQLSATRSTRHPTTRLHHHTRSRSHETKKPNTTPSLVSGDYPSRPQPKQRDQQHLPTLGSRTSPRLDYWFAPSHPRRRHQYTRRSHSALDHLYRSRKRCSRSATKTTTNRR
jgi:hypothetical protein